MNECDSDPCQHEGTCECQPDYNGTLCEHAIPTPPPSTSVPGTAEPDTWTNEKDTSATTGRDDTASTTAPTTERDVTYPTNVPTSGRDVTVPLKAPIGKQGDRADVRTCCSLFFLYDRSCPVIVSELFPPLPRHSKDKFKNFRGTRAP